MLRSLLQKWFGPPAPAGVRPEENLDDVFVEFQRTFCHRPGVNFVEFLQANGVTRLLEWLSPRSDCPIPKSFIRLSVDATRRGYRVWENRQPLVMNYEGNYSQGGLPAQESLDALSVLAQVLELPIRLYYRENPEAPLLVREFAP